jgi:signal transduction histidine kinase
MSLRGLLPSRITTQIAALTIVALAAIHAVLTITFFLTRHGDRSGRPDRSPGQVSGQVIALVQLVDAAEPQARPRLVADIRRAFPALDMALTDAAPPNARRAADDPHLNFLRRHVEPGLRITMAEPAAPGAAPLLAVALKDGGGVTLRMPPPPPPPPMLGSPLVVTLISIAVILTLLGIWAARGLILPLRAFAKAAEGFSPDGEIALLPERGPHEIRTAAIALNRMRERIKRLVQDRIRMLAAMGHDLRTPITRLRLRSEFIADEAVRAQMLSDLDRMQTMVESVLVFLRDGQTREAETMIDLASSLQTICDQFADLGHDVRYDGPDHLALTARPDALHRAVTNLVDNAVHYGGKARVHLSAAPAVMITIEDDGPGIPDAQKEAMFEPFVRGDAARGMNDATGFGLGLSIARAAVAANGGTLTLQDRHPSGLAAVIALPPRDLAAAARAK